MSRFQSGASEPIILASLDLCRHIFAMIAFATEGCRVKGLSSRMMSGPLKPVPNATIREESVMDVLHNTRTLWPDNGRQPTPGGPASVIGASVPV